MRFAIDILFPYRKHGEQKDYYCNTWKLSDNKSFEIQVAKWGDGFHLFQFRFCWSRFRDHAGLELELGLFNRSAIFTFYDHRHWNYDEGRWYNPGEEEEEYVS